MLAIMKNDKRLLEFAAHMPTINGQPYYYYKAFGYDDFVWIGDKKKELYNMHHVGRLYQGLLAYYNAAVAQTAPRRATKFLKIPSCHRPNILCIVVMKRV